MEPVIRHADKASIGERIDRWLASSEDYSRSQIQQWIKDGLVAINGSMARANHRLAEGDEIIIHIPESGTEVSGPENLLLDIVYEDRDVAVINKPQGMVVHPAPGHSSGTLVNALRYHFDSLSTLGGAERPGIVHRIDRDTSGLLMVAKNDTAHQSLASQLKAKTVERMYVAIVHGVIAHSHGSIDVPIGRDKKNRKQMAVTQNHSKPAVTHFQVIKYLDEYTYVSCRLETGRTHQIRIHMKYIGHPVAGDPKYGPRKTLPFPGQALHAAILGFHHPKTKAPLRFEALLPGYMEQFLNQHGGSQS